MDFAWCSIIRKKATETVRAMVNPWTQEVVIGKEGRDVHRGTLQNSKGCTGFGDAEDCES